MAKIELKAIRKTFDSTEILKGIDLAIEDGEFIALIGPSGCGKSTLLRIIAGLEPQSSGEVRIEGAQVDEIRPSARNLAMVFQSYALYPHLSVFDNIAVPLRMRRLSALQRVPLLGRMVPGRAGTERGIRQEVERIAAQLELGSLLKRKPGQLSGGQRQRVAVGRAIVRQPVGFLFDEPLSNLDAKLRVHMRAELAQLHRQLKATFVYVTHDQAEAMTMSSRIAVMIEGNIVQIGTPAEVYENPRDIRVAEFVGSPKINVIPGLIRDDGGLEVLGLPLGLKTCRHEESSAVPPTASLTASLTASKSIYSDFGVVRSNRFLTGRLWRKPGIPNIGWVCCERDRSESPMPTSTIGPRPRMSRVARRSILPTTPRLPEVAHL